MNRRKVLFGMTLSLVAINSRGFEKGTYFTRANIWYERPTRIYSTNYHVGQIIPAGSEVEMLSISRGQAKFKDKKTGIVFVLIHNSRHSRISADEFFARYFSPSDFSEEIKKFKKTERDNIMAGSVVVGMSKEAVLAAYGYPPSHMTPNLDGNRWIYWIKRMQSSHAVTFVDNKVVSIK